tara:strand:+ start:29193 stop:29678 length:486 start_codon:yes stop_codon:yes gene_type:complete
MSNNKFAQLINRINLYPPFIGMGIRVCSRNDDNTRFVVELRARWYNRNLFGTHFGGALYAMSDPFYVFILALNLGSGFIVWDKSASIKFLKPAKGTIRGVFEIDHQHLSAIHDEVSALGKNTYRFETDLVDEHGVVVAQVEKEVYVRMKSAERVVAENVDG